MPWVSSLAALIPEPLLTIVIYLTIVIPTLLSQKISLSALNNVVTTLVFTLGTMWLDFADIACATVYSKKHLTGRKSSVCILCRRRRSSWVDFGSRCVLILIVSRL
jgi:hypothetical protein